MHIDDTWALHHRYPSDLSAVLGIRSSKGSSSDHQLREEPFAMRFLELSRELFLNIKIEHVDQTFCKIHQNPWWNFEFLLAPWFFVKQITVWFGIDIQGTSSKEK